ncbi:surfactin synthase thioesterase subunit [Rheinheimera pacifica]|uniref:thioesterase II family protein n=1 Tax=Rheinheimera pacifica TaxID=173990 RepID=UPI00285671A3|nr:thioesterase domain-containing protein [Rheinheimera pacifica]MDR6985067.1 surfactin synthase thioesterase subunit [Rheinheimera pacifica]
MTTNNTTNWLGANFKPVKGKMLLFCLPFAGGGSQFYTKWQALIGPSVQVCPVYLPGRERRIRDPLYNNMMTLVDELVTLISPFTGQPYAFFGHSMGALISHLLACKLLQSGYAAPQHLFVSARGYMSAESMQQRVKATGFEQYLNSILGLSSQTAQVLENVELRKLFLPIFRADVQMCAEWQDDFIAPLPCPITAFYGDMDQSVSLDSVCNWQAQTHAAFDMKAIPGEHLFILQQSESIVQAILHKLSPEAEILTGGQRTDSLYGALA